MEARLNSLLCVLRREHTDVSDRDCVFCYASATGHAAASLPGRTDYRCGFCAARRADSREN